MRSDGEATLTAERTHGGLLIADKNGGVSYILSREHAIKFAYNILRLLNEWPPNILED